MRQFQYVDEYIATNCESVGDTFYPAEYREWMEEAHPSQAHKWATQLALHRENPKHRVFTTECLRIAWENGKEVERAGLGPNAFYRVVETGRSVKPSSVLKMHLRESTEMVSRWENEARHRMDPVGIRDKRAQAAFEMARAEVKAVALMLHARMRYFDGDEPGED